MTCSYLRDHLQHIRMCVQLLTVHYKSCHHISPALHGSFHEGSESSVVSDLCLCSREVIHDVVAYGDMTCVQKDLKGFHIVFPKIYSTVQKS